jgi:hypothetical protein
MTRRIRIRLPSQLAASFAAGGLSFVLSCPVLAAQNVAGQQPAPGAPSVKRVEGTDAGSGIHYVRLSLSLPTADGASTLPPRFTMECRDKKGKHDLLWYVSFGGVPEQDFEPPFHSTQTNLFPPQYPSVKLKAVFEGYMKSRPFVRAWVALPSGELRFCNSGIGCTNMEAARDFIPFLNALPGLRITGRIHEGGAPEEAFFPTRPLLDEMQKIPICEP